MDRRLCRVVLALLLATLVMVEPGREPVAQTTPTILFLVAVPDQPGGDSYVLPLRDPVAIDRARTLIDNGPGPGLGSIVVAQIAAGADGVNRDHRAPGEPEWSWHVTTFLEFAEITAEICDGTPTLVEADVEGWLANTGGIICFWPYTVVQELGPLGVGDSSWSAVKAHYE